MKTGLKRHILFAIMTIAMNVAMFAGNITVKAKLDSAEMLMGRLNMMRVEVVQDAGVRGVFPLLEIAKNRGYAGVCGDSVEIRQALKCDTTDLGSGRIQLNLDVPVQSFDSGYYKLPGLLYVCGRDTVFANSLTLKVNPVQGVTADSQISPFTDVLDPDNKSVFDVLPDWIVDWWWVYVLIILLCVGGYLWHKNRKPQDVVVVIKPKSIPKPWDEALRQLESLKQLKLWESGRDKEYFTKLTDLLRKYLDRRFGINAMEMTSRQIMDTLRDMPQVKDKREFVRQILDIADFVKFAKVRPLPDDNTQAFENAVSFVKNTQLSGEEEDAFMQSLAERIANETEEKNKDNSAKGKGRRSRKNNKGSIAKSKRMNKVRKERKS